MTLTHCRKLQTKDDQNVEYFKSVSTFVQLLSVQRKYTDIWDPRTCSTAITITEAFGNEWLQGEKEKKGEKKYGPVMSSITPTDVWYYTNWCLVLHQLMSGITPTAKASDKKYLKLA